MRLLAGETRIRSDHRRDAPAAGRHWRLNRMAFAGAPSSEKLPAMRSALCACLSIGALLGLIVAAAASAAPPPSDGVVDLLTAANAEIVGPSANARTRTVGGGGDVNGDGLADVLVGSPEVGAAGRPRGGSCGCLPGGPGRPTSIWPPPAALALARIDGAAPFDELGAVLGDGGRDVNGDGAADILVGAPGADNNGRVGSGSAYVIFGGAGLSDLDLAALGASGARIDGAAARRVRRMARGPRGRCEP